MTGGLGDESGALKERRAEVLRQASIALQGRVVILWEVSKDAAVAPLLTSVPNPPHHATVLDLDATLRQWGAPIVQGSRWVGCHLDDAGRWCVAPVRAQPAAPPPGGVERRGRERITLELAGLCVGLLDRPAAANRPRLPEPEALGELARHPSVIAHEVANPLNAALLSLDLCRESVRDAHDWGPWLRERLVEDLGAVAAGIERAVEFLRSIQDRARGTLARSERFDAVQVVRSCVTLERALARKRGVGLDCETSRDPLFLQGDPNALYQILTNLIRNAVDASRDRQGLVAVKLERAGESVRLTVRDQGAGIASELLERVFEPGFTTKPFGTASGMGLTVVGELTANMFGGTVDVDSALGEGSTFTLTLPIPQQRTGERRRGTAS